MVESYDDERGDVLKTLCAGMIDRKASDFRDPEAVIDAIECFSDGLWLNAIIYPEFFTRDYCVAQMQAFLAAQFPDHFKTPVLAASERCSS
jgi:hypothetical protein